MSFIPFDFPFGSNTSSQLAPTVYHNVISALNRLRGIKYITHTYCDVSLFVTMSWVSRVLPGDEGGEHFDLLCCV